MATRRWGISAGEDTGSGSVVTEAVGAATAADTVELTVDLAGNLGREQVLVLLEAIKRHIMADIWPPA